MSGLVIKRLEEGKCLGEVVYQGCTVKCAMGIVLERG